MTKQQKEEIGAYQVLQAAIDYYGEDNIDSNFDTVSELWRKRIGASLTILIRFPKVTVTNEHNKCTIIYDLFVKCKVNKNGSLYESPRMMRTTYTMIQWLSGYAHSHLPMVGDTPTWNYPCFGSGPIVGTISRLENLEVVDTDVWGLFFYELEKFTKRESLDGGPYIRLESIGGRDGQMPYPNLDTVRDVSATPVIPKEQMYTLIKLIGTSHVLKWSYDKTWNIGNPSLELVLEISKVFILAIKAKQLNIGSIDQLINASVLLPVILKDNQLIKINRMLTATNGGVELLKFKDKTFNLNIIEDSTEIHYFYVLNPKILTRILNNLITIVNHEYDKDPKIAVKGESVIW